MDHVRLCINVDHVATVRNARGVRYPDPAHLAVLALNAGADGIVAHLREDRRHIVDRDVFVLRSLVDYFGLEFAMWDEVMDIAEEIKPELAMLVPEKREELTTEGGLDVVAEFDRVTAVVERFQERGIDVSLFVDPHEPQIEAAAKTGARIVELHTGTYADAPDRSAQVQHLNELIAAARRASKLGLRVHAGHGLRVDNVGPVAAIPEVEELSIGHSIVARAIAIGMEAAVVEMREAMCV